MWVDQPRMKGQAFVYISCAKKFRWIPLVLKRKNDDLVNYVHWEEKN